MTILTGLTLPEIGYITCIYYQSLNLKNKVTW